MIGIAILHALFVDLVRMSDKWGTILSVAVSAAAFAVYHDVRGPGQGIDWPKAISLLVAGGYFGFVYVSRGFGVVVAVHALYDLLVLVLLRRG
jgi:membrane protease YdiL (CAAX protease family)